MPLTNSYNALATGNQQPEYQMLWEPLAIDPASAAAITFPSAAGAGAWVPGALLTFNTAGVGATPGPGGDGVYTVQYVDLAPVSSTTYKAGVLLGVNALGSAAPFVPNTIPGGPAMVAMVGLRGLCQVLVDNTTTIGHTLIASTTSTHTGQFSDSGGSTFTWGTTLGIALQAVTVSGGPLLCWAAVNFPL
jgi:hypothetical protein